MFTPQTNECEDPVFQEIAANIQDILDRNQFRLWRRKRRRIVALLAAGAALDVIDHRGHRVSSTAATHEAGENKPAE
jgi:hypothetical protein